MSASRTGFEPGSRQEKIRFADQNKKKGKGEKKGEEKKKKEKKRKGKE